MLMIYNKYDKVGTKKWGKKSSRLNVGTELNSAKQIHGRDFSFQLLIELNVNLERI